MIRAYLLVLFLLLSQVAFAQQENPLPGVQQKIKALTWAAGKWQGSGYSKGPDGTQHEFKQTVEFAPKIKNSVLLLNEIALRGQDTLFQNLGLLSYNTLQSQYTLLAYTNGGTQVQAQVEAQDKKMIWHIQVPGHLVRYTIKLNEKGQWHQIGEVSPDEGKRWHSFFESTLTRLK